MSTWTLRVAPSAMDAYAALTPAVAASLTRYMTGPLVRQPHVVGRPLVGQLTGYRSARYGPYRIVYRLDDEKRSINVVRVAHGPDRPPYGRPPVPDAT